MKIPLSAVVITHNESKNIERCLKSLDFCDDIVVVDSFSTDDTPQLVKELGVRFFQRAWDGYGEQKNYANSLARYEWVLSLDADESVSEELKEELVNLFSGSESLPSEISAYSLPRKTIHLGRWIKYGGWYPNHLVRLFRKSLGQWSTNQLHERWLAAGPIQVLNGDILHYSFDTLSSQVIKNDKYSSLGAIQMHQRGVRFKLLKVITKPVFKFFETYFLKFGFLDGFRGFFISISAGYSVFLKWAKLWEIEKNEEGLHHHH